MLSNDSSGTPTKELAKAEATARESLGTVQGESTDRKSHVAGATAALTNLITTIFAEENIDRADLTFENRTDLIATERMAISILGLSY
jgi:hypothetical protein